MIRNSAYMSRISAHMTRNSAHTCSFAIFGKISHIYDRTRTLDGVRHCQISSRAPAWRTCRRLPPATRRSIRGSRLPPASGRSIWARKVRCRTRLAVHAGTSRARQLARPTSRAASFMGSHRSTRRSSAYAKGARFRRNFTALSSIAAGTATHSANSGAVSFPFCSHPFSYVEHVSFVLSLTSFTSLTSP